MTPTLGKLAADIRKACDRGDLLMAQGLFDQIAAGTQIDKSVMDSTITPLLRSLVQSGECAPPAQMLETLRQRRAFLDLRQASQVLVSISQRCAEEDVRNLVASLRAMLAEGEPYGGGAVYFGHFCDLLLRDFVAEVQGGLERLRSGSVDWLAKMGWCMPHATMVSVKDGTIVFRGTLPVHSAAWQKSDTVVAMPLNWMWARGNQFWLEGQILELRSGFFVINVYPGAAMREGTLKRGSAWRVDKIANKVILDRQIVAMRAMCQGYNDGGPTVHRVMSPGVREIILREAADAADQEADAEPEEPTLCARPPWTTELMIPGIQSLSSGYFPTQFFELLNQSQQQAVHAALGRTVTLVQGPPGTGKTRTAVGIIEQWARNGVKPVLAVCDSNAGVEKTFAGVQNIGLNCVRIGTPNAGKASGGFSFLSDGLAPSGALTAGAQSQERNSSFANQTRSTTGADVVCCTCAGAGSDALDMHWFQAILIQEASQATEPSLIVPLCKGAIMVTLVGDHEQLPATVLHHEARGLGLARSLFDRLQARHVEPMFLDVQYHMHPAISAFPSMATYGGRLTSAVYKKSRPSPRGFRWPVRDVPIAFMPVHRGFESKVGSSFTNQTEATMLVDLVRDALQPGDLTAEELGVITPYQEQVQMLRRMLPENVECSTVEGFQGREKELILVSTVRAGGTLGSVSDRRRTNVTLTRARRGLIVVGHAETLSQDSQGLWGMWLDFVVKRGLVAGSCLNIAGADPSLVLELSQLGAGISLPASMGGVGGGEQSKAKRRRLDPPDQPSGPGIDEDVDDDRRRCC